MTEEPTIKIKLKTEMLDLHGLPIIQPMRLRLTPDCEKMTDEDYFIWEKKHTLKELNDMTPKDNLAEAFVHILNQNIKSENNAKAAELFMYIRKFNNIKITDKAEWVVTKDELKKFHDLLKTASINISPVINGQVDAILEEYYAKLVELNSHSKK